MNKFGIHVSNSRHRQFDRLLDLGVDHYTGLHLNVRGLRRIRERHPTAHIVVRFYLPDWSSVNPRNWAEECAYWAQDNADITRYYTPANEMNLPNEGGGWTEDWYSRINAWLLEWAEVFLERIPDAILHWPALAQGHYEDGRHEAGFDLPWAGYDLCRSSLDIYDVVDVHPYWRSGGVGLWDAQARWYAWRFVHDRERFFSHKPVYISECGNFAAQHPSFLAEIVYFTLELYEYPWVIGATPFIWDSGSEHSDNIWVGNEALITGITEIVKPEAEFSVPEPIPRPRYEDLVGVLPTDGEYASRDLGEIDRIVIHHTVSWMKDEREFIVQIARYHLQRGWPGIGYHYCISRDGVAYRTNPLWKVSYHSGAEGNPTGVGIAFLGNYDSREWSGVAPMQPTDVQMQAAKNLIASIRELVSHPVVVVGHRDLRPTRCPGDNLYGRLRELEQET